MKSLVVVADDPLTIRSNRFALRHAAGFRVIATIDGRGSARAELARLRPDVVLVNDMCQRTNVLARIREAGEAVPAAKVVLLSGRMDGPWFDEAFAAGADAVIARTLRPAALGLLLQEVADGTVVHAPRVRDVPEEPGRVARLVPVAGQDASAARTSA
jgi:DNA-binding NarL/FixJ family response regulator